MKKLDFKIWDDINPNRILFSDLSEYKVAPVSPKLHIKFPNFEEEFSTPVQSSGINILNTERLKFTDCVIEFQDGVYTFTLENNNRENELKRKVFITTQAEKKLSEWINSLQLSDYNNKEILEKFNKINLYLQGAKIGVCSNQAQSEALYKQAEILLKCADVVKTK